MRAIESAFQATLPRHEFPLGTIQDVDSMFECGKRWALGLGRDIDWVEALDWFLKAATKGHVEAQNLVGVLWARGLGCDKDEKAALRWFEKASRGGSYIAKSNISLMEWKKVCKVKCEELVHKTFSLLRELDRYRYLSDAEFKLMIAYPRLLTKKRPISCYHRSQYNRPVLTRKAPRQVRSEARQLSCFIRAFTAG